MIVRKVEAKHLKGLVWEVTVIRSGLTSNGELFGSEVLESAVSGGIFENLPVHAYGFGMTLSDTSFHHTPDNVYAIHPSGTFLNRVGHLRNARMGDADGVPAIIGEIHVSTDDLAQRLLDADENGKLPELSIDVITKAEPRGEFEVAVTEITRANSLDLVSSAAAGGAFLRNVAETQEPNSYNRAQPGKEQPMEAPKTIHGLREAFPDLTARLIESEVEPMEEKFSEVTKAADEASAEVTRLTEANEKLTSDIAEVRTACASYEADLKLAADKLATIEAAAEEARLTEGLGDLPDWFKTQLMAATPEDRELMIADRKERFTEATKSDEMVTGHGAESNIDKGGRTKEAVEAEAFSKSFAKWAGHDEETTTTASA